MRRRAADEDGSAREGLGVVRVVVTPVDDVLLGESILADMPAQFADGIEEVASGGMIRSYCRG